MSEDTRLLPEETQPPDNPLATLQRRFRHFGPLSPEECALVRGLAPSLRLHPARTELCPEGSLEPPRAIVSGWACRQRVLSDGRRQIVSFLLPGDLYGASPPPRIPTPCGVVALTPVETVDAAPLTAAAWGTDRSHPGIIRAVRGSVWLDEVILRDQIVRLGRQTAYERVAHLLLELRERLAIAGLAEDGRYPLPVTQEVVADSLGLSVVHVNRILQQMRREGALEWRGGTVGLPGAEMLRVLCDWSPLPLPGAR